MLPHNRAISALSTLSYINWLRMFIVLGLTLMSSTQPNIEDAVISLEKRVEEILMTCQKDMKQLTKKMEDVETVSRKRENELFMKFQEFEETRLEEKVSEIMQLEFAKAVDELSDKLQKDRNSFAMTDNYILMELQGMQKKAFEAMEKINNVTYTLERERSEIQILQVKMNETGDVRNSCLSFQGGTQDVTGQNISLSAESLRLYVNESLKLGFESMQSKMRNLETSLLKCEKHCANDSYISQLNERLQNLDKTVKDELQPIQAQLNARVKHIEDRNKRENSLTNISVNLHEDNCSPPCQNGSTCVAGNICICDSSSSGERCQDGNTFRNHSLCGVKPSIQMNGRLHSIWPWMAALYCDDPPYKKFLCGGSIIDRHFILTTAHCLPSVRKEKNITVYIGSRNTSDVSHEQEFITKKIHIHPLYNAEKYDYDIALLELEKPIDYNFFMRPVCLQSGESPASSSELVALGLYQYRVMYTKEDTMSISPSDVCKKTITDYYGGKYFSDRGFCAGINEQPLICDDGRGAPAMQSHVNKEGLRIWTQVGIISWGGQCGSVHNYLYFTDLKKLMPWVDSIINEAKIR